MNTVLLWLWFIAANLPPAQHILLGGVINVQDRLFL
ncbi:putative membrane protein [Yersinia enterocolitica]|nr:putative membrane protein [Yersinia enterocolitica]